MTSWVQCKLCVKYRRVSSASVECWAVNDSTRKSSIRSEDDDRQPPTSVTSSVTSSQPEAAADSSTGPAHRPTCTVPRTYISLFISHYITRCILSQYTFFKLCNPTFYSTAPPACSLRTIWLLAQMYKLYRLYCIFHSLYILPVVTIVAILATVLSYVAVVCYTIVHVVLYVTFTAVCLRLQ